MKILHQGWHLTRIKLVLPTAQPSGLNPGLTWVLLFCPGKTRIKLGKCKSCLQTNDKSNISKGLNVHVCYT